VQRAVEQIIEIPVTKIVEETVQVPEIQTQENVTQSQVEQIVQVPKVVYEEEIAQVPRVQYQEQIVQRPVEQIVQVGKFRAMRALRAFRPLRLISRNPGMKIIVDDILGAIPQIMNTLLVSLLFFFVFAILGESFFKGGFYACSGLEDDDDSMIVTRQDCEAKGGWWRNADVNFDNCGAAMYMLFQLAAGAGWDELMFQAVDMVGIDMQPKPNSNTAIGALFFVGFTVLGNFVNH
jgi:hypothetical protein